jgi:transcription antitermination factor NusG
VNNVQTAITAIRNATSGDELNQIFEAIKLQRRHLDKQAAKSFMVGDTVEFLAGPQRGMRKGTVTKFNINKVKVKTNDGIWNVPAEMLSLVS